MNENRREFLKWSGVVLASGASGHVVAETVPTTTGSVCAAISVVGKLDLPKARGPRLVIVGAGTSGLSIAAHARKAYPRFDVVLIDKRDAYASGFCSSLWYVGLVDHEFIAAHSFLDAAARHDYLFVNAVVTGLDRAARTLVTSEGELHYDFLVLAPGVSYDYARIGVTDPADRMVLSQRYPAGFVSPMEHVSLRRKFQEFEGGLFVQTVPSGNYRCLPAPYERACLMAGWIKRHKLKGKVLILDANPEIASMHSGFQAAFDELYKGIIEWKPGVALTGVDVAKKLLATEFDSFPFDDASIYPNIRASSLIEQLGLVDPKSLQKEANVDVRFNNVIGDPHVYVAGDARNHPYSKSANTASTEGRYVAQVLAARAKDREVAWTSPESLCFSMVDAGRRQAIKVFTKYLYDAKTDSINGTAPETRAWERRDQANGRAYLEWAQGMYAEMFG